MVNNSRRHCHLSKIVCRVASLIHALIKYSRCCQITRAIINNNSPRGQPSVNSKPPYTRKQRKRPPDVATVEQSRKTWRRPATPNPHPTRTGCRPTGTGQPAELAPGKTPWQETIQETGDRTLPSYFFQQLKKIVHKKEKTNCQKSARFNKKIIE